MWQSRGATSENRKFRQIRKMSQEIATSGCALLTMTMEHFYMTQAGNCMQPRINQGTKVFLAAESMSLMRLSWLTSLAPGS